MVYDNLKDLASRVEWQDILDQSAIILDEAGNIYAWDNSKRNEIGTVYDYSFKVIGSNQELIRKCKDKFMQLGKPISFELETKT